MSPQLLLATAAELPRGDAETPRLAASLGALGIDAEILPWTEDLRSWETADAVIVRSTWDYTQRLDEFLAWADTVQARTTLWNPASTIRWNAHKGYLCTLADAGLPVLATTVLHQGDAGDALGERLAAVADEVVVKPAVDAGGRGAAKGRAADPQLVAHAAALLERGDVLVQPFAHAVVTEGEYSVVVMGDAVLLARRKLPAQDEFRIHEHHGGRTVACALTDELADVARVVLTAVTEPILYARVDMVRHEGELRLMELELIEPFLYLDTDDEYAAAARAIAEAVGL